MTDKWSTIIFILLAFFQQYEIDETIPKSDSNRSFYVTYVQSNYHLVLIYLHNIMFRKHLNQVLFLAVRDHVFSSSQ